MTKSAVRFTKDQIRNRCAQYVNLISYKARRTNDMARISALIKIAAGYSGYSFNGGSTPPSYASSGRETGDGVTTSWTRYPSARRDGEFEVTARTTSNEKVPVQGFWRNFANELFPGLFKPTRRTVEHVSDYRYTPKGKKYVPYYDRGIHRGYGGATYVDGKTVHDTYPVGKPIWSGSRYVM